jgi:hypothetical protein
LQVDAFHYAGFGENMIAARHAHAKTFRLQELADVNKA